MVRSRVLNIEIASGRKSCFMMMYSALSSKHGDQPEKFGINCLDKKKTSY